MINNEKEENHHLISPTAKLVAHLRAKTDIPYSEKIDKLCEAGKTFEDLFGKNESLVWMSAMIELRYKSLSKLLEKEMSNKGISQVLELACGVQPRGLITSSDSEITYIETDLPKIAVEKKTLVRELDPKALGRDNYHIESLNVLDDENLRGVVSRLKKDGVVIINEGLLPYLSVEEKSVMAINIFEVLKEKRGIWITPDISNSNRMRKIITLFPDAEGSLQKISSATDRNLRDNRIGDKETTLKFYEDIGFNLTEYSQKELVGQLNSLESIKDDSIREKVDSVLDESKIWVLEVE